MQVVSGHTHTTLTSHIVSEALTEKAMAANAYPRLADLVGGWFHQDYDIKGETIPEIMGSFLAVTPVDQQQDLRLEISRFLIEHAEHLDEDFEEVFQPDVAPAALSGSTLNFLSEISDVLAKRC